MKYLVLGPASMAIYSLIGCLKARESRLADVEEISGSSAGAILALFHDVIVTLGIFSLFSLEINLSIIAAVLTIVGYSMNDTVVIFDRVRENLRKYSDIKIFELTNISINETLSRTIITSATTLLAL
jgi:preprotein translocase subunit SecF